MMKISALAALLISGASASCPNACSGHGTCTVNDVCECYQDWQSGDEAGGDCSDRTCASGFSWADVPAGEDVAHGYAECSGAGLCNRKTGLCECFDGFTGKACRRTTCPNDCSGHGTCEYLKDVYPALYGSASAVPTGQSGTAVSVKIGGSSVVSTTITDSEYDFGNTLSHDRLGDLWDQTKTRMCVCDAKFTDVDCSRRMCPKGNDVLDRAREGQSSCEDPDDFSSDEDHQQLICFMRPTGGAPSGLGGEVALVYSDLFGNTYTTVAINIRDAAGAMQTALRSLPDHALEEVVVTELEDAETMCEKYAIDGSAYALYSAYSVRFTGAQVSGEQPLLDVKTDLCEDGCQPSRTGLHTSPDTDYFVSTMVDSHLDFAHGNAYECGRRGKCDYSTGICECFTGFTDEDCSTQSALA